MNGEERMAWLPPLLTAAAAAAAAEIGTGLLLYLRGGFLGALTLVLCAQMGALAAGLWTSPRKGAPPWNGVRRAWFVLLLSHMLGAVVAATWEALGGLAGTALARGLGLAFLVVLPLYATGLVLGAPALARADRPGGIGAPAALGAALGFAAVGAAGGGLRVAASAYAGGVVAISVAALVHGNLLARRERRWREWAERGAAIRHPAASADALPAAPETPPPGPRP